MLHRIFKITSNASFKYVSYFTNLLPIKYQIDLCKLRFWRTVHSAVLTGCSKLVWDVLGEWDREGVSSPKGDDVWGGGCAPENF